MGAAAFARILAGQPIRINRQPLRRSRRHRACSCPQRLFSFL